MPQQVEIVGVGASAGGVEALATFVAPLPADLPAAVLVVLHVSRDAPSVLDRILSRASSLPARPAVDGEAVVPGQVYVGVPDCHLRVEDGHLRLDRGPRENGHRPAVDVLMRSLASSYGPRAAGVILSGARDDGTAGIHAIKKAGGWALVQDPAEASAPGMPASALAHVPVDAVLPVTRLASAVTDLAVHGRLSRQEPAPMPYASGFRGPQEAPPATTQTTFACPDCGGVLIEEAGTGATSFRCQVGHRYAITSLVGMHGDKVEEALWTAVRSLLERAHMLEQLAGRMSDGPRDRALRQARDCRAKSDMIRIAIPAVREDLEVAQS